jgi:exopolyphosphatase/pppGpp-phosphohydrolase
MEKEEWYSMGKLDRYDGPARSEWAEDGTVIRAEYFIKDRPVGPKEALIARDKIRDAIRKLPIPIRDEIWQYYCTV